MNKLFSLCVITSFIGFSVTAQDLKQGDLDFLKGVKSIEVKIDYNNFRISNQLENDYVTASVTEKNQKKAGDGDQWKLYWDNYKNIKWPQVLTGEFERIAPDINWKDSTSMYVIVLKSDISTGFDPISMSPWAKMTTKCEFVERSKPDNILAVVELDKIRGDGLSNEDKILLCYFTTAKRLGKFLKKKAF